MLVNALPRSASTSLAEAVADALGVDYVHTGTPPETPDDRVPREADPMWRAGSWCHWPTGRLVEMAEDESAVYREHIPPTEAHARAFHEADRPVAIHVRHDVHQVVQSFRRRVEVHGTGVPACLDPVRRSTSPKRWYEHAEEIGLHDSLREWVAGWRRRDPGLWLFEWSSYLALLEHPKEKVEWLAFVLSTADDGSVDLPDDFELPKARYTRGQS